MKYVLEVLDAMEIQCQDAPELIARLENVAYLTNLAGGRLVSRQVIAAIVEQWEREE